MIQAGLTKHEDMTSKLDRPNLLVVCGRNKRRSRTAEYIFKNDQRFNIRSVGLSPRSERQVNEQDVHWADLILVMEPAQSRRMTELYRRLDMPPIEVLHIADDYEYREPVLVEMLTGQIDAILKTTYGI